MELDGEVRKRCMDDTFIGSVVCINEIFTPSCGESRNFDCESVILRRDVTTAGEEICARNIMSTISLSQH